MDYNTLLLNTATIGDLIEFLSHCDKNENVFTAVSLHHDRICNGINSYLFYKGEASMNMNNDPAKQEVDMEKLQESYDAQELDSKRHYDVIYECTLKNIRVFFAQYKNISNRKVLINGSNDIRVGFDKDGNIILGEAYNPKDGFHVVKSEIKPEGEGKDREHMSPEEFISNHCNYPDSLDDLRSQCLNTFNRRKEMLNQRYGTQNFQNYIEKNHKLDYTDTDYFAGIPIRFKRQLIVHEIKRLQVENHMTHEEIIEALISNKKYRKAIKKTMKKRNKLKKYMKHEEPIITVTIPYKRDSSGPFEMARAIQSVKDKYKNYIVSDIKTRGLETEIELVLKERFKK